MDRKIESKLLTGKRLMLLGALVALIVATGALLSYLSTSRMRVERDKLTIDSVRRGSFQEFLIPAGEVRAGAAGPELRVDVDRYDAPRLAPGQRGEILPAAGSRGPAQAVEILRIGAVEGHNAPVDLRFVGPPPAGLAPGETVHVRIPLGEPGEALLLARGAFFQATGGHWVYVVDEEAGTAARREIRLGRQNPEVHEVLSGLTEGERVITSTYDHLGGVEELVLTQ